MSAFDNMLTGRDVLAQQAQLLVQMTTRNFEEAISAGKQGRPPQFKDWS